MFTIDTNILIYYAAGDPNVEQFFEEYKYDVFYLPSIVVIEFLSYSSITLDVADKFRRFVQQMIIVDLDFTIAESAAELRRKYKLDLADGVIAASALATHSTLVTRNTWDFRKVKSLSLFPC